MNPYGPDIKFVFEDVNYTVTGDAYNQNLIRLPDGRLLHVNGWFESYPPRPSGFKVSNLEVFGGCPRAVKVE